MASSKKSFNDIKILSIAKQKFWLRNVAAELFALKKALLKNEIDVFRFARKLRKRTRYYLKEISRLPKAIGASRVAKNILKSERMMWNFFGKYSIDMLNNRYDTMSFTVKTHILHNQSGELERVILNLETKEAEPFSKPLIYCFLNHSAERRQFRLLCLAALLE